MEQTNIISVDLGGTKILTSVIDKENNILNRVKMPTTISKGPGYIVECIAESVEQAIKEAGIERDSVKAVCMGVPGTVDPQTGEIFHAPNLKIKNFNIKQALQKKVDLPVLIENDVNIAALGIKRFEFHSKVKNMLVVFVGTGIGGALIFDNKLYRGSTFFAGEIGHMKVGKKGQFEITPDSLTFEGIASRTAMVKAIETDIKNGKKSVLESYVKDNKKIKSKSLANAAAKGDKVVTSHLEKGCKVIGTVLGSLTTLLNVDTIVLGGGVLEAMNDYMMPKIQEAFDESVLPEPGKFVKIVATKLGDDAPLYGGPELAEEFLN